MPIGRLPNHRLMSWQFPLRVMLAQQSLQKEDECR